MNHLAVRLRLALFGFVVGSAAVLQAQPPPECGVIDSQVACNDCCYTVDNECLANAHQACQTVTPAQCFQLAAACERSRITCMGDCNQVAWSTAGSVPRVAIGRAASSPDPDIVPAVTQRYPPKPSALTLASFFTIQPKQQYDCDVDPSSCQCTYTAGQWYQCTSGDACYACNTLFGQLECQYCYQVCNGPSGPGVTCISGYHWNSTACEMECG